MSDYRIAYIVVKGRTIVTSTDNANRRNAELTFKNNASFKSCISKINNAFIDNEKDVDIVMLMYSVLEYSDNYYMTLGSLWNCYRDK